MMVLAVLMAHPVSLDVAMVAEAEVEEHLLAWVQEDMEGCQEVAAEAVEGRQRR
jgi:hypothetical protein